MYDDYHSTRNNLQLDPENYDSVTAGYVPQDEKAICRFFRANGRCRRGTHRHDDYIKSNVNVNVNVMHSGIRCNQLHVQPNPKGFTHDRTLVFVDVPSLQDLPVGGLVSVQVTCVMNGYRFFAVLPLGTRDLGSASSDTDEPETLATLQV